MAFAVVGAGGKFSAAVKVHVKGELANRWGQFTLEFLFVVTVNEAVVRGEVLLNRVVEFPPASTC